MGITRARDLNTPGQQTAGQSDFSEDPRVKVTMRSTNGGVGAAMITEYQHALDDGMDIVIKLVDRKYKPPF